MHTDLQLRLGSISLPNFTHLDAVAH